MIEANVYDDQVVIVSEYAPDGSLDSWMKRHNGSAPSVELAVNITIGILSGLEHLHSKKILHRDLKPGNILLQGETPRLADFGLSKIQRSSAQSSNPSGTPAYMSPEAFDGKKLIQTDLWAVGVIFYQLLTAKLPFLDKNYSGLIGAIITKEPKPLPLFLDLFQPIITKTLQKKPEERYKSASEMKLALQGCLSHAPKNILSICGTSLTNQDQEVLDLQETKLNNTGLKETLKVQAKESSKYLEEQETLLIAEKQDIPKNDSKIIEPQKNKNLYLLGLIILLFLLSGVVYKIYTYGSPKNLSLNTQEQIKTFEFETLILDENANILERKKKEAKSYSEDLGNKIELDLVEIPRGSFLMGSDASEANRDNDESPTHKVNIRKFYMGKYEVTQAQWQAIMGSNPSEFKGKNLPVENVSWDEAIEFCRKLSQKTGREYRLPTEAEWEYACRATTITLFAFGKNITPDFVNYDGSAPYGDAAKGLFRGKTVDVGSLKIANQFGLYDMLGNVWEWCQDGFSSYTEEEQTDPKNNDGSARVTRGGGWSYGAVSCRSADRRRAAPGSRSNYVGFRIARAQ